MPLLEKLEPSTFPQNPSEISREVILMNPMVQRDGEIEFTREIPFLRFMSVLYEPEDELVIAYCLEWDIASQGKDVAAARLALAEALEAQRDAYLGGDSDVFGERAPNEIWDKFREASKLDYPGGLDVFARSVEERLAR